MTNDVYCRINPLDFIIDLCYDLLMEDNQMKIYKLAYIIVLLIALTACSSSSGSSDPIDTIDQEDAVVPDKTDTEPVADQPEIVPEAPRLITTNDLLTCDLPVYEWCDIDLHAPIYEISVEMKKGDIWEIIGEAEFTDALGYNICIVSSIKVNGAVVGPINGFNVTPNTHHAVISRHSIYQAKKSGYATIQFCVMCASSAAEKRDRIRIENMVTSGIGYGQLTAVRL